MYKYIDMNRTELLYATFAKSCNTINELYEKVPLGNWSRPKPSSMTTTEQLIAMQRETYKVKSHLDLDLKKITVFNSKMNEMDLKYIELEKMAISQTKKFWEERMIPSIPTIERLITETEYCETILNDIEALNELETSGLLRETANAELEKKRIEWVSFLHKFKDRIKPQLIYDDDIKTMDKNIILLEITLEQEKNKYENKIAQKTEWELYLNNQIPALEEGITTLTHQIDSTKIGMERTELMIEHKKIKKMYFSGFKEYIQKLSNCIDKSIEKHSINCDIDPKLFHTIS